MLELDEAVQLRMYQSVFRLVDLKHNTFCEVKMRLFFIKRLTDPSIACSIVHTFVGLQNRAINYSNFFLPILLFFWSV